MRVAFVLAMLTLLVAHSTGGAQPAKKKGGKPAGDDGSLKNSTSPPTTAKSPDTVGGKRLHEWVKDLTDDDASRRTLAILAIMSFGDSAAKAVPDLIRRTNDTDISPRSKALVALRTIAIDDQDVTKVVRALVSRLDPRNERQAVVRYEAAIGLRRYYKDLAAAPEAIPTLITGANDTGSWEIRYSCIGTLWRYAAGSKDGPDPRCVEALVNRLTLRNETYQVRLETLTGLGAMGKPTTSQQQEKVISTLMVYTNTRYPENRPLSIWAYASLVAIQEEVAAAASLNKLAGYLTHATVEMRGQAAQALGSLGPRAKPKLQQLIAMLKDKEPVAVQAACLAIAGVGDKGEKTIDALLETVEHKDPGAAGAAVVALVRLKANTTRVTEKLDKMIDDKKLNISLRYMIEVGLKELKAPSK